jgi:hypothetical protein
MGIPGGMQPIEELLINTVATKTWADNGGTGSISYYDRMLIISQTQEVHGEIAQLLADLRAARQATRPTLSVELRWLWLDAEHRRRLLAGREKLSEGQLSLTVDRKKLRQIAREVPGFHGRLACINGIETAIAAGDRRAIISSAIPVVGGDSVGYQPVISAADVGVTAQVRPTCVPGTKTAMLDIASVITRWDPSRKPAIIGSTWPGDKQADASNAAPFSSPGQTATSGVPGMTSAPVTPSVRNHAAPGGSASCPVDQPVMPTQRIGTTLQVPLGEPVIVGSMTFAPANDAGLGAAEKNPVEVYLIATTSIVRDATK